MVFRSALFVLLALPSAFFLRFVRHRGRSIWLVGERSDQACDNGFHLFRYVRTHHPGDPAFYVITRDSRDLGRVAPLGNVVYHGELRHYAYWLAASCLVCAHITFCAPERWLCWLIDQLLSCSVHRRRIYLTHGIVKELLPYHFHRAMGADLYVCGAAATADFVATQFGYPAGTVRCLGVPRFDALPQHQAPTRRQVLLMPTWRRWFSMARTRGRDDAASREQLLSSPYYGNLRQLLEDPGLQRSLEAADHRLLFYVHYMLQPALDLFATESRRVAVLRPDAVDVQELLVESALLVTDYSSVAFDFAYMEKPVLYFQFDRAEYDRGHHAPGYFDYGRDGFGPVVATPAEVAARLARLLLEGPTAEDEEYRARARRFFAFRDTDNCRRVCQAIRELAP